MPNPEEWYNHKNAREIIYLLFDRDLVEKRIRVRFRTKNIGKTGEKDIDIFSVGLEVKTNGKWTDIVRHCNHHAGSTEEFHTHNKYKLSCLGDDKKIIMRLSKRKTAASQMRWAISDIKNEYNFFIKEFFRREENV